MERCKQMTAENTKMSTAFLISNNARLEPGSPDALAETRNSYTDSGINGKNNNRKKKTVYTGRKK